MRVLPSLPQTGRPGASGLRGPRRSGRSEGRKSVLRLPLVDAPVIMQLEFKQSKNEKVKVPQIQFSVRVLDIPVVPVMGTHSAKLCRRPGDSTEAVCGRRPCEHAAAPTAAESRKLTVDNAGVGRGFQCLCTFTVTDSLCQRSRTFPRDWIAAPRAGKWRSSAARLLSLGEFCTPRNFDQGLDWSVLALLLLENPEQPRDSLDTTSSSALRMRRSDGGAAERTHCHACGLDPIFRRAEVDGTNHDKKNVGIVKLVVATAISRTGNVESKSAVQDNEICWISRWRGFFCAAYGGIMSTCWMRCMVCKATTTMFRRSFRRSASMLR